MRIRVLFFGLLKDICGRPEDLLELPEGSTLVICTDGLWGYFPEAEQMGALVRANPEATENELATRMVNLALVLGGDDNVTVAVVRGSGAVATGP